MMYRFTFIICFMSTIVFGHPCNEKATLKNISSPDKRIRVSFCLDKSGAPYYALSFKEKPVLGWSPLGFTFKKHAPLKESLILSGSKTKEYRKVWEQVWGEKRFILNHYRELKISLKEKGRLGRYFTIVFRVFNDGLGFRYEFPSQPKFTSFTIMEEHTGFYFTGNHKAWWIPALTGKRYEILYQFTDINGIPPVHTPFTVETKQGLYLSLHEANLRDYSSMTLKSVGKGRLACNLVPWKDGTKVKGKTPMKTPWRTLQIAEKPGDLITSYLILNLNEPNQLTDTSWIEPMKYIGIWWGMHLGRFTWGSGPKHGATTERAKQYINSAASLKIPGLLIEGWNVGWDGDWIENGSLFKFTEPYPDFDIQKVASYAKDRGVEIIGHHETAVGIKNYESQVDKAFAYYRKLGIRAVKTGYVGKKIENGEWHHGQYMVRHYRLIAEKAAKYGIMLDIHEPIKDTGIRRTLPNIMSREGARGQEYNAWSEDGGNPPSHTTILPFTRLLSGPFDFTPGIFNLTASKMPGVSRVRTTLAKQLALYVVIYSPLQMAADLPENYGSHPTAFQFIKDVPVDWETTIVLNAKIGEFITIARKDRKSRDWYLGSITDDKARRFKQKLGFLKKGKKYHAEIYQDGKDAHYLTKPHSYFITKKVVTSDTVLDIPLAAGGGQAIRFTPLK